MEIIPIEDYRQSQNSGTGPVSAVSAIADADTSDFDPTIDIRSSFDDLDGPTFGDRFSTFFKSLGRGINRLPAGFLRSMAVQANKIDETFGDTISSAFGTLNPAHALGRLSLQPNASQRGKDDYISSKLATFFEDIGANYLAPHEDLQTSFFNTQLPDAVGTLAAYVAGTALTKNPTLFAATAGSTTAAAEGYTAAIQYGASEEDAFEKFILNTGVGATEAVPIMRMFNRIDKGTGGFLRRTVIQAAKEGSEEAVQELIYTIGDNFTTMLTYNEDEDIFSGLGLAASQGFSAGAMIGFATEAILGRRARMATGGLLPDGSDQAKVAQELMENVSDPKYLEQKYVEEEGEDGENVMRPATEEDVEGGAELFYVLPQTKDVGSEQDVEELGDGRIKVNNPDVVSTDTALESISGVPEVETTNPNQGPNVASFDAESIRVMSSDEVAALNAEGQAEAAGYIQDILSDKNANPDNPDMLVHFGIAKSTVQEMRKVLGFDALPSPKRRGWISAIQRAYTSGAKKNAESIVAALNSADVARPLADHEVAAVMMRKIELYQEYEATLVDAEVAAEAGDRVNTLAAQHRQGELREALDQFDRAISRHGTEAGRALAIMRMQMNAMAYDENTMMREMRLAKQAPLTAEDRAGVQARAKEIRNLNVEIKRMEENEDALWREQAEKEAEETIQQLAANASDLADAKKRRKEIEKELNKLGFRMNDLTGVAPEVVYKLGKWAMTFVQGPDDTVKDIIARVRAHNPTLSESDVLEAINTANPNKKQIDHLKTEAVKTKQRIKREAKIYYKLEQALLGNLVKEKRTTPQPSPDPDIDAAKKHLAQLRKELYKQERNDQNFRDALDKIDELSRLLGVDVVTPTNLEKARNLVRQLKQLEKYEQRLADISEMQKKGDYSKLIEEGAERKRLQEERRANELPQLREARNKLHALKREARKSINNARPWSYGQFRAAGYTVGQSVVNSATEIGLETIQLARGLKASADLSFLLRQGIVLLATRPTLMAQAFGKGTMSFWSHSYANEMDRHIRHHPNFTTWESAGLYIAPLGVDTISGREEMFMSRVGEHIPWVRASERAMVNGLNLIRAGVFDAFLRGGGKTGRTDAELKAYADYVNVASGRGRMKSHNAALLSTVFFAPRFAISRFQTPLALGRHWQYPAVRKAMARDLVGFAAEGMGVLALASLAGWEVGLDIEDADFGKITIGNTRVDIWGGLQQPMRLLGRVLKVGSDRALNVNNESDVLDMIGQFTKYKFAPSVTIPYELVQGKDVIGQDRELLPNTRNVSTALSERGILIDSVVPLFLADVAETWAEYGFGTKQGNLAAGLATVGTTLGVGVSTYNNNRSVPKVRELEREFDYSPRGPRASAAQREYMTEGQQDDFRDAAAELFDTEWSQWIQTEQNLLRSMPEDERKVYMQANASRMRETIRQVTP